MFDEMKACKVLRELAGGPVDLTKELDPRRVETMLAEGLGFKLFYATERVDEKVLEALVELARESQVLKKMEAMQAGEKVNFIQGVESENRAAMHTAMRDFFEHPNPSKVAQEATKLAYEELQKLKSFLEAIDERFTDLVQIGIGGSELGPLAIYRGLEAFLKPGRRVHFISNVDPDEAESVLRSLDLQKTLVVVVSKSGSTLETLTNQEYVKERFRKEGMNAKEHLIAVTGKGSPMDDPNQYLASFYIWDYVGGRYSVTSMVGAVALAFAFGMDRFLEFLHGASAMDKFALLPDEMANLPLLYALLGIWNRNFLNHPTTAIIPYSHALSRFPAHLQQLDMESNGKQINKEGKPVSFDTGPIIWGEPGTNGQHSFYQLIHQGTTVVPLELIGFCHSQYDQDVLLNGTTCQEKLLANLFAQAVALAQGKQDTNPNKSFSGNRPSRILLAQRLDPFTLGALLALYEHKVAFQGFIWNINSFDQEGVQLGKTLASKFTDLFADKRREQNKQSFPLGSAYLSHIE